MKTVFGDSGQPAGSIDGDHLYWADGRHICFLDEGYIFKVADGEWVGSLVSGIFYNTSGKPVGFVDGCKRSLALIRPKLEKMLPPQLKSVGPDVRGTTGRPIPDFLVGKIEPQKAWMLT